MLSCIELLSLSLSSTILLKSTPDEYMHVSGVREATRGPHLHAVDVAAVGATAEAVAVAGVTGIIPFILFLLFLSSFYSCSSGIPVFCHAALF